MTIKHSIIIPRSWYSSSLFKDKWATRRAFSNFSSRKMAISLINAVLRIKKNGETNSINRRASLHSSLSYTTLPSPRQRSPDNGTLWEKLEKQIESSIDLPLGVIYEKNRIHPFRLQQSSGASTWASMSQATCPPATTECWLPIQKKQQQKREKQQ